MIVGAQLYTVRAFTQTEDELNRTLEKVAAMGYPSVQLSAIGPIPPERVRALCDRYDLKVAVTHTDQERIRMDTDRVVEEHRILGTRYIGIGSMPQQYRTGLEGVRRFIADFRPAAERIAEAGLWLQYHNHDFEWAQEEGKTLLEHLAAAFDPELLGFILDTFWVQAGGGDPAEWIRRLAGRLPTVHLKDMGYRDGRIMLPVGAGNMNMTSILDACADAGDGMAPGGAGHLRRIAV